MRKKTLVTLFIWSVLLCIGGPLLFGGAYLLIGAFVERHTLMILAILGVVMAVIVLCGLVLGTIAWIGGLVKQGKQEEWGWFICTLLFGNLVLLIYLIAVPERSSQMFAAVGYPNATPGSFAPAYPQQPAFQAPMTPPPSALAILEQRFARGEIDMATYQQMREMLARNS